MTITDAEAATIARGLGLIYGYECVLAAGRLASSQSGEARRVIIRARRMLTRAMGGMLAAGQLDAWNARRVTA